MSPQRTLFEIAFIVALGFGMLASYSHNSLNQEMQSIEADQPIASSLESGTQKTFGNYRNDHRTCTFTHKGSNGSTWKTKWC